jgi:hypothetical protein
VPGDAAVGLAAASIVRKHAASPHLFRTHAPVERPLAAILALTGVIDYAHP